MTAHTTRAHAKRSPSSAYRWMNCAGSIRMSEGVAERKSSIFADEGTAAHMLAERCLSTGRKAADFAGRYVDINATASAVVFLEPSTPEGPGLFEVDEEMVDGVQLFLDTVWEAYDAEDGDILVVEHRVNFSGDDDFGTADAAVYKALAHRVKVFDLKYGSGVFVEVKDDTGRANPQLVCYVEGVVREFADKLIDGVDITIVQPRIECPEGPVRTAEIGLLELMDYSMEIDAAIARTEDPNAPLVPGDWCGWCPAAGACPAFASRALAVAQMSFDDLDAPIDLPAPEGMSPMQRAKVLDGLDLLEAWAKAVRAHAYSEAAAGNATPGWKLVNKQGRRRWADEGEALRRVATMKVPLADCFVRKFKSPAQIETLTGKKDFASQLADIAPTVSSGTTLAREGDKRPAVVPAIENLFDDLDSHA